MNDENTKEIAREAMDVARKELCCKEQAQNKQTMTKEERANLVKRLDSTIEIRSCVTIDTHCIRVIAERNDSPPVSQLLVREICSQLRKSMRKLQEEKDQAESRLAVLQQVEQELYALHAE